MEFTGAGEVAWDEAADAVYLGLSRSAAHPTLNADAAEPARFAPHNAAQVRVLNMLSAHAVLYLSGRYKAAVVDALTSPANQGYHQDVLMARLQPSFLILANKQPSFYQANLYNYPNDLETQTRFCLAAAKKDAGGGTKGRRQRWWLALR